MIASAHALRVLLSIHHSLNPNSGAPGATFALGLALRQLGHSVRFLSFNDMPSLPPKAAALAYPAFAAASFSRRGEQFDVVDASTGDAWIWAFLRRRRRNAPVLVSRSHGLEHLFHENTVAQAERTGGRVSHRYRLYHGGYRLWEVARSLRGADAALFLNPTERDFAVAELGVSAGRAYVIPNGIPKDFFDGIVDLAPSDPGAPIGIAQIGGWRKMKGTEASVRALGALLERHPRARVSLLGTELSAEAVRADFPAALRERVAVVPAYPRERLPELLRGHQVQLFPSLSEGFGLGLLEGMACGLAPVAGDTPGPATIVRDGHSGLLVDPRDPTAITAAVERLLADRTLLAQMQLAAREESRRFGLGEISERTGEVYLEAIARRSFETKTA